MKMKIVSSRINKNCSINWKDVDKMNLDDKEIDDLIIYSSEIDNPRNDVNKIKKLNELIINGSIAIVSSDTKTLEYLAFALKDIKATGKNVFYEGKQDESLKGHFSDCKKLGYRVTVPPETIMWLSNSNLEMVDNISLGYELNMGAGVSGMDRLLNDVNNKTIKEQIDTIISDLLDKAESKGMKLTALDKIVYVSNYIQANYQYCQGIISYVKETSYEVTQKSLEEIGLRPIDSKR